jgi:hypothetical protein
MVPTFVIENVDEVSKDNSEFDKILRNLDINQKSLRKSGMDDMIKKH